MTTTLMTIENEFRFADCSFWYNQPAEYWYDGLPVANGRIGAMVYGGARAERIALSETTFWSGEPSTENNPPGAPALFRKVREQLLAREIDAANELAHALEGRKLNYGTNLPFGNLRLYFNHEELQDRDYRRELNLDEGIARVSFRIGDEVIVRETFVSAPHQVLVVRVERQRHAGRTGAAVAFRIALDGDEQPYTVQQDGADALAMTVYAHETLHSDGHTGVTGHARLRVLAEGGTVKTTGSQIEISGANAATLVLAMGTTFNGVDSAALCAAQATAAAAIPYEQLRAAHVQEHRGWFRRARLDLGPNPHPDLPLNQRIDLVRKGGVDGHLAALLFQFGRYLLIGSSRPDSPLPAALLGAWNDNKACRIGWTNDYHLDINTQMNYWVAELTGLGECQTPLFRWMQHILVPSGRRTAQALYGLPGWVAHIVSNAWGFSAWGWSTGWGVFPTGGVWTAMHLWDHYTFGGDRDFLADTAYPILKEAAEFFLAYMEPDPQTGWLISGPSNSPENGFLVDGKVNNVALSPTVDRVLIDELFGACCEAATALGIDAEFGAQLSAARRRLPPYQIGKHGQIQEWLDDVDEAVPGHRHTSHLLGLYPFAQVTPGGTPELAHAARVSLARRMSAQGYEEGSWARNNTTLFYARLEDGAAAYNSLMTLLRVEAENSLFAGTRLAPAHAYEMDYNTGAAAGIAEMLLHSHAGCITLLPALPAAWPTGSVSGLRARGGFEVDITWADGQLVEARVTSAMGLPCRIRNGAPLLVKTAAGAVVETARLDGIITFATTAGATYLLEPSA